MQNYSTRLKRCLNRHQSEPKNAEITVTTITITMIVVTAKNVLFLEEPSKKVILVPQELVVQLQFHCTIFTSF